MKHLSPRIVYWPAFFTVGLALGLLFALSACTGPSLPCWDPATGATSACPAMVTP